MRAYVKKEYYEKFNAKEFTLEDFGLDNIESFSCFYRHWEDKDINGIDYKDNRLFLLKLKKTGKKHAREAIDHITKLEFVERADFNYVSAGLGTEF